MKRVFAILDATEQLNIKSSVRWSDDEGNIYQIEGENITNEQLQQIENKADEILSAEPMRLLREERNRRIALTDWRFRSDLSPSQEWKDYCVALRDLPANYSPTFDILTEDNYPLVKEDNTTPWPEEPSDG